MSRKAKIAERRRWNAAIGKRDAENRCDHCKAALVGARVENWETGAKYCSDSCFKAAEDVAAMQRQA